MTVAMQSAPSSTALRTKADITYALFEIDPANFYSEKFNYGRSVDPSLVDKGARRGISYQKIDFLLEALAAAVARGGQHIKILDWGCGSGLYGKWVKHRFPSVELVGIDMSAGCVQSALESGYDRALAHDFLQGMPFADNSFDFVFSMDVFGHIEFASKDHAVKELYRVTKPGGTAFHAIESGYIDYFRCNPANPADAIRKYVYIDGHIGVEPLDDIVRRFRPLFEITAAFNWLVTPVLEMQNVLKHEQWGADFSNDMRPYSSPECLIMGDAIVGHFNRRQLDFLFQCFGRILTRERIDQLAVPLEVKNYLHVLTSGGGCSMLSVTKPAA